LYVFQIKDTDCTECQLAHFAQDKDLLSPHVMQSRNSASNYSFNHTTLRFCLRKLVRTLVLGNTETELASIFG